MSKDTIHSTHTKMKLQKEKKRICQQARKLWYFSELLVTNLRLIIDVLNLSFKIFQFHNQRCKNHLNSILAHLLL